MEKSLNFSLFLKDRKDYSDVKVSKKLDLETSSFQGIDSTSLEERTAWFGSNNPQKP